MEEFAMNQSRFFAFDATFTVTYIAVSAGLAILAATLLSFHMLNVAFTTLHWSAAGINVAGALALPFAPRLYRKVTGANFDFSHGPVVVDEIQ